MQHALYRLNGDYNPLHICLLICFFRIDPCLVITLPSLASRVLDPALGKELGFPGVIMHGVAMYSMTARAIVAKIANNDPSSLKSIYAYFSDALIPGGMCIDFPG